MSATDNEYLRRILFALTGTSTASTSNSLLRRIWGAFTDGATWQFRQQAKPTTRPDGSALVVGDRWYSTDDLLWFAWNGTYWLSEQLFDFTQLLLVGTGSNPFSLKVRPSMNYFLERFETVLNVATTNNGTNFWTCDFQRRTVAGGVTTIATFNSSAGAAGTPLPDSQAINTHVDISATSTAIFTFRIGATGTPGTLNVGSTMFYRLAKP